VNDRSGHSSSAGRLVHADGGADHRYRPIRAAQVKSCAARGFDEGGDCLKMTGFRLVYHPAWMARRTG